MLSRFALIALLLLGAGWPPSNWLSGTPTIGACGTGSPTVTAGSTNGSGSVTTGTVTTSCSINFSATLAAPPTCVVSSSSSAIGLGWSTSTSALTVVLSASLGGGKISYLCW
jgi:hypothetical protein